MSESRCNEHLKKLGKPNPRTCQVCTLGPCKHPEAAAGLTTQQKALALRALVGSFGFSLMVRENGTWYVSLKGVSVRSRSLLATPTQAGATPDAAIDESFSNHAAHSVVLMVESATACPRFVRWNGFMWEDVEEPNS